MCGIAGWYCFGDARPDKEQIMHLWNVNLVRGRDAAGAAFLDRDGDIVFYKNKGPADALIKTIKPELWATIEQSKLGLLHTRAHTKGSPHDNVNNHPVEAGGWLVTHNGVIRNDDDLVGHWGLNAKRPAAVDSVAINLALAQGKTLPESLKHLSVLAGSASFAAVRVAEPTTLVLARLHGPQFYLAYDAEASMLFWSSEGNGCSVAEGRHIGVIRFSTVSVMPDRTVYVLRADGETRRYGVPYQPFFRPEPPRVQLPGRQTDVADFWAMGGKGTGDTKSGGVTGGTCNTSTVGGLPANINPRAAAIYAITGEYVDPFNGTEEVGGEESLSSREDAPRNDGKPPATGRGLGAALIALENYDELCKPSPIFTKEVKPVWYEEPPQPKVGINLTLATAYGRWYLHCEQQKDNTWRQVRQFKANRRVKQYWNEWMISFRDTPTDVVDIRLPAEDKLRPMLDSMAQLERVATSHKGVRIHGLMCPWCGITAFEKKWFEWRNVCGWCGIMSYIVPAAREVAQR